jgi:transcription factor E
MQEKFLKDIVSLIAGQEAVKIVDLLYNKKNVNEFNIAKKLNLNINQTRNILYKLADQGLVSFIRKKDSRKGGWYTYFWTLDISKSLEHLRNNLDAETEKLRAEMERRKHERFYYSPNVDIEYSEEDALQHDFIDPESGEVLQLKDNGEAIARIGKDIDKIRLVLNELNFELAEIQKKEDKIKEKKLKAEAKLKEEERLKKKKAREREKKKLEKLKGNKKAKKVKKSRKSKKKIKKL